MQEQYDLSEMIQALLDVDDESWGLYSFSRDLLKDRIPEKDKIPMIHKAMECGISYAKKLVEEVGTSNVHSIAKHLKLNILLEKSKIVGTRILFASYTPPNEIQVMTEPVEKFTELIHKNDTFLIELFNKDSIMDIIIGHEIYHFIEDQFEKEIYTRTEKILLWNFLGFKNLSTIRNLGEIAAMAFTKELNGLSYSPFILDVLLYYSYDYTSTRKIYHDVLGIVRKV